LVRGFAGARGERARIAVGRRCSWCVATGWVCLRAECGADHRGEQAVVTDRDRSVVAWVGVVGAVSARDVMQRFGVGTTVGRRRLRALVAHGLFTRTRLVYAQPAPYVATREELATAGLAQVAPARVKVSTNRHGQRAPACVVAARGEGCEMWAEPPSCAAELDAGRPIASAELGYVPDGRPRLRRPDFVLFPPIRRCSWPWRSRRAPRRAPRFVAMPHGRVGMQRTGRLLRSTVLRSWLPRGV
jgi:hypothetical protein